VNARRRALLGRSRELDALAGLLQRAAAGEGAVALVTGEPGIGKTALLEEAAARAAAAGFAVAWGRAWELGSAPTYWPWIEALRALFALADGRDAAAADVARLLPELAARGTSNAGAIRPEVGDSFALCDAVCGYLHAACERQPVLLVLDDLHAADPSSLQLALFVARSLRASRFCLLGSHRDVEARLAPALEASLSRLVRDGEVLALQRLAVPEVERWVRDDTGRDDAMAARMIHDATEGNPLFVRELLRLLASRGVVTGGVPAGVRAVIRERLSLLSPATVALLQAAAVVGREFSVAVAAEVAGVTPSALDEAAAEARAADLLLDVRPGVLRFSHALVAETLAADLAAPIRARLHRRAAEALERRAAEDSAALDEIAHHFSQAGADAAPAALLANERAAQAASARLAFADAAAGYERALAALSTADPGNRLRRAELLIAQGEAHARAADRTRAETACSAAAELAVAMGDSVLLCRAALALGAESMVGSTDPPLIGLLERALSELPPGDGPWRARAMARLASARQPAPDPSGPVQLGREAIAMARRLGDDEVLLHVLHSALGAFVDYAPAKERAPLNQEAARLAASARDRPRGLRALMRLIFDRVDLGELHGFEAALAEYEALAQQVAQPRYQWVPLMFRSMRAYWEGRFADAERLEAEALLLHERSRGDAPPLAPGRRLAVAFLRDEPELIETAWADYLARYPSEGVFQAVITAHVEAHKGQLAPASELVHGLQTQELGPFGHDVHALDALSAIAWFLRDKPFAERLYPLFHAYRGLPLMITGTGFMIHGMVDHALMRLSAVCGRNEQADAHAEAALALCARLGAKPFAARVRCDWALLLLERGGSDAVPRARELVQAAQQSADALGLGQLGVRCRELQARLGGESIGATPTAEPVVGVSSDFELTLVREGEYWTLRGLGALCRVRDSRGLQMLAQLLEHPGRELHVLDLSGALEAVDGGDSGEVLDHEAKSAYQQRLRDLGEELEEAAAWNDSARQARLQEEVELLRAELSRAVGLGARERRGGSAIERARVNVRRRIALALRHVTKASPVLGRHLSAAVRTGVYCAYEPRPARA
jgi:hypothetical protein